MQSKEGVQHSASQVETRAVHEDGAIPLSKDALGIIVADNKSTQVLSEIRMNGLFGPNGINFKRRKWQALHVVRVKTADNSIKEWILDGNHRASGLYENWDPIMDRLTQEAEEEAEEKVIFIPTKLDVTKEEVEILHKDMPPEERPDYITVEEFWLRNTEYTRTHADIEQQRTVGNLITGWKDLVGETLAEKYTGFAAVATVTSPQATTSKYEHDGDITPYLDTLFAQDPEREQLTAGLITVSKVLSTVITESNDPRRVNNNSLLHEAVNLVGPMSVYIGGPDVAKKHRAGITKHPAFQAKLIGASEENSIQDDISSLFEKYDKKIPEVFDKLFAVLTQPEYRLADVTTFLNAQNPETKFNALEKDAAKRKRHHEYASLYGRPPTSVEITLLNRQGQNEKDMLTIHDIGEAVREVDALIDGGKLRDDQRALLLASRRTVLASSSTYRDRAILTTAIATVKSGEVIQIANAITAGATVKGDTRTAAGQTSDTDGKRDLLAQMGETIASLRVERDAAKRKTATETARADALAAQVAALEARLAAIEAGSDVSPTAPEPTATHNETTAVTIFVEPVNQAQEEPDMIAVLTQRIGQLEMLLGQERQTHTAAVDALTARLHEKTEAQLAPDAERDRLSKEVARLEQELARRDRLIVFKTTAVTEAEATSAAKQTALLEQVAENRRLLEENMRLREQLAAAQSAPTSVEVVFSAAEAAPSPPLPPERQPEALPSIEVDRDLLAAIDERARTVFVALDNKWDMVHEIMEYKRYKGLDAVAISLVEKLTGILTSPRNDWTIDSPYITLMIAHHYAGLLKKADISEKTNKTIDTCINKYKEANDIPVLKTYTDVMQILLYSEPDDPIHDRCYKFLNNKPKTGMYGPNTVTTFEATSGMRLKDYMTDVFSGTL